MFIIVYFLKLSHSRCLNLTGDCLINFDRVPVIGTGTGNKPSEDIVIVIVSGFVYMVTVHESISPMLLFLYFLM